MSNFTTKKLSHSSIKKIDEDAPSFTIDTKQKRRIQKYLLITLIFLGCIFGINYIVQGIGKVQIGTAWDGAVFTPIFFSNTGDTDVKEKWITNILIVGIGWAGHQAGNLADSIMLASLDEEKESVTIISIPRDLYVNYGTGKWVGKINSLYPIWLGQKKWISLLANKVSEITGQSIHHYMVVDFSAFRYIVNALDGIQIDVEKDLYDDEYPDYDYGYQVFSVKKWLQNFDGETALKYARSRHSTSDMDRSHRQQQIIDAIKTKSLSAGVITNPNKISNIIDATRSNINTDLTVKDIVSIGSSFANVESSNIHVYNLGNDCFVYQKCTVWAYLYSPSMAYFGGAWALIPEGARISHLSYYDRIHRFVDFVFQFPGIHISEQPIVMVSHSSSLPYAKNLLMEMKKIWINYDPSHVLKIATGTIEQSHINIYWNAEYEIWFNSGASIVQALKYLDMRIPVNIVKNNEYVTTDGPKIEIVLGKDYKDFFIFSKPVDYLPKIASPAPANPVVSWENLNDTNKNNTQKKNPQWSPAKDNTPEITNPSPYKIAPGEWEQL